MLNAIENFKNIKIFLRKAIDKTIFICYSYNKNCVTQNKRGDKMINCNKIKARIIEMGFTQGDVAKKLNIAQSSFNLKINGKRPLSVYEAEALCTILKIDISEIGAYFFNKEIA